jgi:hypothetical protein
LQTAILAQIDDRVGITRLNVPDSETAGFPASDLLAAV